MVTRLVSSRRFTRRSGGQGDYCPNCCACPQDRTDLEDYGAHPPLLRWSDCCSCGLGSGHSSDPWAFRGRGSDGSWQLLILPIRRLRILLLRRARSGLRAGRLRRRALLGSIL